MTPAETYYYPNRMGRILFLSMEEILGRSGLNAVLNFANLSNYIDNYPPYNQDPGFSFIDISRLQVALEQAYGPRSGRGLAQRIGRVTFKYSLREFGAELGLTDLAFRLLPLQAKLKTGTEALAGLFNKFTDQRVRLEWDEKHIHWQIERCPFCWERSAGEGPDRTNGPCCNQAVGFLQEAL